MMAYIFVIIIAFALLFDIVTWRYFASKWSRIYQVIYLTITVLTYLIPLIGLVAMSDGDMRLMMWGVLVLMCNIGIKKSISVMALIGWIIKRIKGERPRWIGVGAWILVSIVCLILGYGATIGRNEIRVERVDIFSDKIPQSFDGYKIVQFSDLHIGNLTLDNDFVERMVEVINEEKPDLVVQSGDLVNILASELEKGDYLKNLQQIKANDGVVSVLGNHDLGFYIRDTTKITPKATIKHLRYLQKDVLRWKLLENENFSIYRGVDSIDVSGVTYPKNLNHNNFNSENGGSDISKSFKGLSDSTFRLFVTHNPKLFDSLPEKGRADLVLSGHVHSMQMAITLFGKKFSPASLMYAPFSGYSERDKMSLYINDGVGYVMFPFRLGAQPEITVFTLHSKE